MPSRTISRFRSESQTVIAGALETAEEVAGSLAETFDVFLEEGEKGIDWALLQKLISRRLADKGQRLADLDSRLEVSRSTDKHHREERDRIAAELRRELRSARFLLDESLGREVSAVVFRWRSLSQVVPATLVEVARETAASLRTSPSFGLARLERTSAFPEASGLADALEQRALELENQLGLLAPKQKRQTFAVGEKGLEWRLARSARMRVQDLLFGLYRAAGKDHLASRLRPKPRVRPENPEAAGAGGASNQQGGGVATAAGMAADGGV